MMKFLSLPRELVEHTILYLGALDILSCQLVNKHLRRVVTESVRVQYHVSLELSASQNNSQSCIPLKEKLAMLKASEESWKKMRSRAVQPISLNFHPSEIYDMGGNTCLLGDVNRQTIHYLDLGTNGGGSTEWKNFKVDKTFIDAGLCVFEHDLIAVVTTTPLEVERGQDDRHAIEISLLQYSTGEPHPLAQHPSIFVMSSPHPKPAVAVEIVGKNLVLILMFVDVPSKPDDRVYMYDWMESTLKCSFTTPHATHDGFIFLNPTLVLLPNAVAGTLDTYAIPSVPTLESPSPLVRLSLPRLSHHLKYSHLSCRAEPNPVGDDYRERQKATGFVNPHAPTRPFLAASCDAICLFSVGTEVIDHEVFTADLANSNANAPTNAAIVNLMNAAHQVTQNVMAQMGPHTNPALVAQTMNQIANMVAPNPANAPNPTTMNANLNTSAALPAPSAAPAPAAFGQALLAQAAQALTQQVNANLGPGSLFEDDGQSFTFVVHRSALVEMVEEAVKAKETGVGVEIFTEVKSGKGKTKDSVWDGWSDDSRDEDTDDEDSEDGKRAERDEDGDGDGSEDDDIRVFRQQEKALNALRASRPQEPEPAGAPDLTSPSIPYSRWGPAHTRWFDDPDNRLSMPWITTSCGQRLVLLGPGPLEANQVDLDGFDSENTDPFALNDLASALGLHFDGHFGNIQDLERAWIIENGGMITAWEDPGDKEKIGKRESLPFLIKNAAQRAQQRLNQMRRRFVRGAVFYVLDFDRAGAKIETVKKSVKKAYSGVRGTSNHWEYGGWMGDVKQAVSEHLRTVDLTPKIGGEGPSHITVPVDRAPLDKSFDIDEGESEDIDEDRHGDAVQGDAELENSESNLLSQVLTHAQHFDFGSEDPTAHNPTLYSSLLHPSGAELEAQSARQQVIATVKLPPNHLPCAPVPRSWAVTHSTVLGASGAVTSTSGDALDDFRRWDRGKLTSTLGKHVFKEKVEGGLPYVCTPWKVSGNSHSIELATDDEATSKTPDGHASSVKTGKTVLKAKDLLYEGALIDEERVLGVRTDPEGRITGIDVFWFG